MDRRRTTARARGKLLAGVLALAALAMTLAACGGASGESSGGDSTGAEGRPLVKADWAAGADTICVKARRGGGAETGSGRISVALLPKASDFLRRELSELERLPVPPGQSVQIERLLGQLRGVADLIAQESERLGGGGAEPQGEYELDRLLTTLGTPIMAMDEGFLDYGAKACGEATFGFPVG